MNADTEHLEGQGVNQPRQNETDSMRLDSLTSLSHSHCNDDENSYSKMCIRDRSTCSELTIGLTYQTLYIYDTELYFDKQVNDRVANKKAS